MVTSVTNRHAETHSEPADPVSARARFLAELQLERFGPVPSLPPGHVPSPRRVTDTDTYRTIYGDVIGPRP